jgi:hypothetical protein
LSDKDSPGSDEKVIRGILQYCVEHPYAKDTPEGILKWWRPRDKSEWRKEDVQKALDFLTSKGWLTVRNTSPPEKIYGFNKKFMEEIRKFLNESEKDKGD